MNRQESSAESKVCISIIVPVYNAQAHLAACLSSIQTQTFMNWECICVDDGSTDGSPIIMEDIAAKDERFSLLHQKNSGPGAARNTGLKAARGEYFTFVDADDLVHPEMLERLLSLTKKHGADLVVCRLFRFEFDDEFRRIIRNPKFLSGETSVNVSPLLPKMVDWKKFRVHPVGKLYQLGLHGQLRFPHFYGAEDAYASFDVYGRSKRAVISEMRLYGYRIVETGLTRSVAKYRNYIIGDARVAVHCDSICSENGVSNTVAEQLAKPYIMRIFGFLNEMSMDEQLSKKEKKSLIEVARKGLLKIEQCVAGKYQIVPFVHYVPYCAVRLRTLWLLILWQLVRSRILKRGLDFFRSYFGSRKLRSSASEKGSVTNE
jgi:glycosyltransferase involved in cell wall biosynthesis